MTFHVPEEFRIRYGVMGSQRIEGQENDGAFLIRLGDLKNKLLRKQNNVFAIASDGGEWEHVSVSMPDGTMPSWDVMCQIKDLFWDEEDEVIQIHPKKSEYVNLHQGCLHLWRPIEAEIQTPPSFMVVG